MQHLNEVISDLATKTLWLCGGYAIVAVFCFLLGLVVMFLWNRYKLRSRKYYNILKTSH